MTRRLDGLPRQPDDLGRRLARLEADVERLRAATPDLSAADAMLAPLDIDITRWPQTAAASWTPVARSSNIAHGTRMRIRVATAVSGGGAGTVRVTIQGVVWAAAVTAPDVLDVTAALPAGVSLGSEFVTQIEALRTSGAGLVHAQTQLIRSLT